MAHQNPGTPRMTQATQLVLRAFLAEPTYEWYGLELSQAAGLPTGTIHPILARLRGLGWLEQRWEDVDPSEAGRPRRRYYRLSPRGVEAARDALARTWSATTRSAAARPGLAGGGSR